MTDHTPHLPRPDILRGVGVGAGAGGLLAACGKGLKGTGTSTTDTLKIGYVSPQTGRWPASPWPTTTS